MAGILTERLMNHRPLLLPLALLVPLALAACNKPAEPATDPAASSMAADPAAPPALADTAALLPAYHWRLAEATDAQGQKIEPLFVNADKPVQLDFAEGRVSVSNTCNRMTGGFTQAGDTATAGPFASTLMACPDPALAALDAEVGRRLEGELTVASTAGEVPQLVLTNTAGDRLVFHGTATPDTRFGGPGDFYLLTVDGAGAVNVQLWQQGIAYPVPVASTVAGAAGEANRLAVADDGSKLRFYVNQMMVAEVLEPQLPAGRPGLAAVAVGEQGAAVDFDWVAIYRAKG